MFVDSFHFVYSRRLSFFSHRYRSPILLAVVPPVQLLHLFRLRLTSYLVVIVFLLRVVFSPPAASLF